MIADAVPLAAKALLATFTISLSAFFSKKGFLLTMDTSLWAIR
jgi:hypothetical protein